MRSNLFLLALACYLSIFVTSASCQITNAGFENWAIGWSGYLDPVDWGTNNGTFSGPSVVQTPGQSGTYAVKLKSVAPLGLSGTISWYSPTSSIKPLALSGYLRRNLIGPQDFLRIQVNVNDAASNQIGALDQYIYGTGITPWTPFTYSITYTSSNTPDEYNISFLHGVISTTTTGFVEIDNVSLTYLTDLNEEVINSIPGVIMLKGDVPDTRRLLFDLMRKTSVTVEIFDISGKKVEKIGNDLDAGHQEMTLNISNLDQGMYICFVHSNSFSKSIKFVRD